MKKIIFLLPALLCSALFFLGNPSQVGAQTCSGQLRCCSGPMLQTCRDVNTGAICTGGRDCECEDYCSGSEVTKSCGWNSGTCNAGFSPGECFVTMSGSCRVTNPPPTPGVTPPPSSCSSGDAFYGITNCGQVGRVNGSGSCGANCMCCASSGGGGTSNPFTCRFTYDGGIQHISPQAGRIFDVGDSFRMNVQLDLGPSQCDDSGDGCLRSITARSLDPEILSYNVTRSGRMDQRKNYQLNPPGIVLAPGTFRVRVRGEGKRCDSCSLRSCQETVTYQARAGSGCVPNCTGAQCGQADGCGGVCGNEDDIAPPPPVIVFPTANELVEAVGTADRTVNLEFFTQSDPAYDSSIVNIEVYPPPGTPGCSGGVCDCNDGFCGVVTEAQGVGEDTQVIFPFVIPEAIFGNFSQYRWRVQHQNATCSSLPGPWTPWYTFRIAERVTGTVYEDNGGPYGAVCQSIGALDPFTGGGTVTVSSAGHPNSSASVSTSDGTYSVLVPVSSNITAVLSLPGMPVPTSTPTPTPTPAPTSTPSGPGGDPVSTVDLRVNGSNGPLTVANGANITVSWSSTNATECRASGAWTDADWVGPRPTSGSHSYTITDSLTYTIRCSQPGELESAEDSVQVNVSGSPTAPPVPSVVLTFNGNPGETSITPGTSGTLSWTSSGLSSCTAGSTWGGDSKPTSGSQSIGPVNSTTTYGITCTGPAGNASSSVRLNISGSPSTPTPTPTPASTPVPTPIVTSNQCICPNSSCQHSGLVSPLDDVNFFVRGNIIRDSWWQVVDGPVQAKDAISSQIPVDTCANDPACDPYVVRDSTSSNATGVVVVSNTSASSIDTSDESGYQVNQIAPGTNIAVKGSNIGEVIENYNYFYRNYSMGVSPTSDVNNLNNFTKPGSAPNNGRAYYANGDAEIRNGSWNVSSGESIVVFINGDLNIERAIQVEEGGFLAFIVKGDITVDQSVCQSNYLSQDPVVEGLYLADGTLTIEGTGSGGDCKFVGGGSFVGWSGVNLQRDFNDGGAQSAWNSQAPAELFVYRPDLIVNLPERMSTPLYLWQEVAP